MSIFVTICNPMSVLVGRDLSQMISRPPPTPDREADTERSNDSGRDAQTCKTIYRDTNTNRNGKADTHAKLDQGNKNKRIQK